jgi:hypothetical protein
MPSVVQLCGSLSWLTYVFVGSNLGSTPSECFLSWYLPLTSKRSRNRCCTLRERSKRLLCSRSLQPDSFGEGNRIGYGPSGIISETSHINSVWDVSERLRKRLLFRSLYPLVYISSPCHRDRIFETQSIPLLLLITLQMHQYLPE